MKLIILIWLFTVSFCLFAECRLVGKYNYQTKYNKEDGLWEMCRELNQDFFRFTYNGKIKTVKLDHLKKKVESLRQEVEKATKIQKGPINESQIGCDSRWEFIMPIDSEQVSKQRGCLTHKTEAYQEFRLHFHSWYGESEI